MQSVSSNAVAEQLQLEGFIKSYEVNYGDVTVSSGNYLELGTILANHTILGHNVKYWFQNTGCFNIMIYHDLPTRNRIFLIANNGVTVKKLNVIFYYI